MPDFSVLEPAIDPNNKITFLLDWELTMKCNLDCTYCNTGLYGGHENSIPHPPVEDCLKTLDFLYQYADLYMSYKPAGLRYVILNVYGGESLHHPDIVKILETARKLYEPYKDRWNLTITTTTNAIVPKRKMLKIIPLIDEFTVSYHAENTPKQKQQFKDNLLLIKESNKRQKCVVLMHDDPRLFNDSENMIKWLEHNSIRYLPRQLDNVAGNIQMNKNKQPDPTTRGTYNQQQIIWFNNQNQQRTFGVADKIVTDDSTKLLSSVGRACCGGRQVCHDQNYKERKFYTINTSFGDWYCSVNWFFVYIKQVTGEIFVNRDCKMSFDGDVGPIGNLANADSLLETLSTQLKSNTLPIIKCKKSQCLCGLCAPKTKELDQYKTIMKKYLKDYTL